MALYKPSILKNSNDLAKKIIKFLNLSNEQKKEMGLNGRKKVEEEFDQEIVFKLYKKVLLGVLGDE